MKNLSANIALLFSLLLFIVLGSPKLNAQNNNMGIGTTTPNASAILDITSNSKGLLIPRLTNGEEGGLSGPNGLLIYNTDQSKLRYYNAGWKSVGLWDLNGSAARYTGGNVETTGGFFINNDNPTIHLQDINGRSGFIHQNADIMYFLNGGVNATTWAANGSYWPLTLNMNTDAATFGGPAYFMEGNVGIGTITPNTAKLVINAGSGNAGLDLASSDSYAEMRVIRNTLSGFDNHLYLGFGAPAGANTYLYSGGTAPTMTLAGGKVGINQTAPTSAQLEVLAPNGDNRAGLFYNNNTSGGAALYVRNAGGGNGIWLQEGSAVKPGGGSWAAPSDERLKTDVINYSDGLQMIRDIRPVSYRYNGIKDLPTKPTYIGIIAQELKKIAPYMVHMNDGYLQVDPNAFTYMLINSVKEMDETVQKQKEIIESQQAEIDAIKKALEKAGINLE